MSLSKEQIKVLKDQLKQQVQNLPEDKKAQALKQIDEMSDEAIETMLNQQQTSSQNSQPIFRMIVEKQIPSIQIEENEKAIAVLSVRAISEGHTLIIPKEPIKTSEKIPKEAFTLAESLSKKIKKNLNAKEIKQETQTLFGESIINLIPIYDIPLSTGSPASEKTPEELEQVRKKIEVINLNKEPKTIRLKKRRGRKPKPIKRQRRIP